MSVRQFKSHKRIVKNVESSLLAIFVKFAYFSIMTSKGRKFSIVKDVGYVVLAGEKTFFTVTLVNAAYQ